MTVKVRSVSSKPSQANTMAKATTKVVPTKGCQSCNKKRRKNGG